MQVGDRFSTQWASASASDFGRRAEIDDAGQPDRTENFEVSLGQFMQGVTSKELSPTCLAAVDGGIATKIAKVAGTDQGQESLARFHRDIMVPQDRIRKRTPGSPLSVLQRFTGALRSGHARDSPPSRHERRETDRYRDPDPGAHQKSFVSRQVIGELDQGVRG